MQRNNLSNALNLIGDIILNNRVKEYYSLKRRIAGIVNPEQVVDLTKELRDLEDRIEAQRADIARAENRSNMYRGDYDAFYKNERIRELKKREAQEKYKGMSLSQLLPINIKKAK
jgi:predicted  nucleic acid-binding Zn-ribbon protein